MLVVLLSVASCGSGSGKGAGEGAAVEEGSKASATRAPDKPLSKMDLERSAITDKDLDGYKVEQRRTMPAYSTNTANPTFCGPIAKALADSSAYPAAARIGLFKEQQQLPCGVLQMGYVSIARSCLAEVRHTLGCFSIVRRRNDVCCTVY